MTPGRELDEWIAQKVMRSNKLRGQFISGVDRNKKVITVGTEWSYLPYSTNITAAWEVVEKLTLRQGWYFDLRGWFDVQAVQAGYRAIFSFRDYDALLEYGETADTAPHAICLAAMKACT